MSFQKDLPPPGIYDGACAIVKRNPSPCIWKALRIVSAEERRQQTCNLGCDHRTARFQAFRAAKHANCKRPAHLRSTGTLQEAQKGNLSYLDVTSIAREST
jgi:hypothetical protein